MSIDFDHETGFSFGNGQHDGNGQPHTNGAAHPGANGHARESLQAMVRGDELADEWSRGPRWKGVRRPYSPQDVCRLRGSILVQHTLAAAGARRLWDLSVAMTHPR